MRIRKNIMIICGCAVAFVIIGFLLRIFLGLQIQHYKQYILPCEGRIAMNCLPTHENKEKIPLYILDEVKLSEFADSKNIKDIIFNIKEGDFYKATSWSIENETGYVRSNNYSGKILNVIIVVPSHEITITSVDIQFIDGQTERFDLGNLIIKPILWNPLQEEVHPCLAWKMYSSHDATKGVKPAPLDSLKRVSGMCIEMGAYKDNIVLKEIDLGVKGLSVETKSVVVRDRPFDEWYSNFEKDKKNKKYYECQYVNALPDQDLNIKINRSCNDLFSTYMVVALNRTKSYNSEFGVEYWSPIYTFADGKKGERFVAAELMPHVEVPGLNDDAVMKQLLEEEGI